MFKKVLLFMTICALMSAPAWANATLDGTSPHLGWWLPGASGSTHQYWDFLSTDTMTKAGNWWIADPPTEIINPSFAEAWVEGEYIAENDYFIKSNGDINVHLVIENFQNLNNYKEIWIDVGYEGTIYGAGTAGGGAGGPYTTVALNPPGPSGVAELGFQIYPNPTKEDIWFSIAAPGSAPAVLDWIHVDTICIPAPGAILLGGIGIGLVGWLRRRRTL